MMCKTANETMLEQQKVQEPVFQTKEQTETKTMDIRQELTRLQTWDVAPDQTLEERRAAQAAILIQQQQEDNLVLLAQAQVQLPPVQAQGAAPGQPVQEQVPAKQSYKQRRKEAGKNKKAQKINPKADHISYDAVLQLQAQKQEKDNSLTPERIRQAQQTNTDIRVLRCFSQGYQTKKNGQPDGPDQARRQQQDNAFLDAYLSGNVQRRTPYLQKFTDELMAVNITMEMLTPEYLKDHAAAVKQLGDRMVYFQNIQKDPINAPFFQNMPPMKLELLNAKLDSLAAIFSTQLVNRLATKGVNCDSAAYFTTTDQVETARQMDEGYSRLLEQGIAAAKQREQEIAARYAEQEKEDALAQLEEESEQMREQAETMEGDIGGLNLTTFVTGYSFDELAKYRSMIEAHPEAYAQHKDVVDKLYQSFYRAMDSMGDLTGEAKAYQEVIDNHNQSVKKEDRLLVRHASQKQEETSEKLDLVRKRISAIADSLQFYLRNKPISAAAKLLLEREGLAADAETLYAQRQVQKAFLGPDGTVEQSNTAYRLARERGMNEAEIRSAALQALGIRNSKMDASKADALLRGTTYIGLPNDIAIYFHKAEKDDGVDFVLVEQNMQRYQRAGLPGGYVTGGGTDLVNVELFRLYRNYVTSDASIAYLKQMTQTLMGAQVFGGDAAQVVGFLSQSLINSYGANFTPVSMQKDSYEKGDSVRMVARECCRTLLSLPNLIRMSEQELSELPQSTQELVEEYRQLIHTLTQQVTGAGQP